MTRLLLSLIVLMCFPAWADIVELTLPNKLVARAEYQPGQRNKPAILLIHGFLQTHEFPVIHHLNESLQSAGYSVLAPTLTLGISERKQSLACEALNTHSQSDAMDEIGAWVKWLKTRHAGGIVMMGHSFGSMEAFIYAVEKRDPAIRKIVGVSILEGRLAATGAEKDRQLAELRALAKSGSRKMVVRPFSFCQKYRSTPSGLLSYLEWTPERILREVNRSRLPITFIMGGKDDRLGPGWIEKLEKTRARVHIIKGANHFMDGEYEFDLQDLVLAELKSQ